jgi:formylglycine-generating enzyme required for sulfatase activity
MRLRGLFALALLLGFGVTVPARADDPARCNRYLNAVRTATTSARLDELLANPLASECTDAAALARRRLSELARAAPPPAPTSPPVTTTTPRPDPNAGESSAWRIATRANTINAYEAYLTDFPRGPNAGEARRRINALRAAATPPVTTTPPVQPSSSVDARTASASTRAPVVRNPSSLPDFAMFRECDGCPEMVILPRGNLLMGSPAGESGRGEDEDSQSGAGGAQVNVTIARFAISRFETTWDEWEACVNAGACNEGPINTLIGQQSWASTANGWGRARRPVIMVDWNDAGAYAAFVNGRSGGGYRRPTEAEWEYAARANTRARFSWGDDDPSCDQSARNGANFSACTDDRTRPVGSFRANPWGLYDMHGNVWEWIEDCYRDNLGGQPSDGRAFQSSSCTYRVLRGGSWSIFPQNLRSANRNGYNPTDRVIYYGFRLARTV